MGVGAAVTDKKVLDIAYDAMTDIAGQKPVFTLAVSRLQPSVCVKACRSVAW